VASFAKRNHALDTLGLKTPLWHREITEDVGGEQPVRDRARLQEFNEQAGEFVRIVRGHSHFLCCLTVDGESHGSGHTFMCPRAFKFDHLYALNFDQG
jgi:hypothetical protein